ncbi:MAG: hypothetical protein CNE99_03620 [OM182 bacterium MED-G24]|uniref:Uncharacterized protein n=1 Tax=OM182 bacterium MED-G24 TaxID=1986255 RepID=A0A2A5WV14_9GAMM|nr:MAG: hypothetical protein CNE99_03620 [OM182 bacterium MED-G24]
MLVCVDAISVLMGGSGHGVMRCVLMSLQFITCPVDLTEVRFVNMAERSCSDILICEICSSGDEGQDLIPIAACKRLNPALPTDRT